MHFLNYKFDRHQSNPVIRPLMPLAIPFLNKPLFADSTFVRLHIDVQMIHGNNSVTYNNVRTNKNESNLFICVRTYTYIDHMKYGSKNNLFSSVSANVVHQSAFTDEGLLM